MRSDGYILYVGGFLNEEIVKSRRIPTRNPAGSNRMHRIANALKAVGKKVLIVSPAISLRTKSDKKILSAEIKKTGNVPVLFTAAIGLPILGSLSSLFTVPFSLISFGKKRKVSAIIIYNFSPLLVVIALLYRFIYKVPIFHNIEDVSIPKLKDWYRQTEVRPIQQLVFFFCMKMIASISKGYIIPTKQFQGVLKSDTVVEIITGCINVTPTIKSTNIIEKDDKINILFSGKIEFEHGIDMLIETIKIIEKNRDLSKKIRVDICGGGSKTKWLRDQNLQFQKTDIEYYGFVTDKKYKELLRNSNICIALQNPNGRYATNKTPSKVYEYLGHYKTVIATNVGDLVELPSEIITICEPYTAKKLYQIIFDYIEYPEKIMCQSKKAGTYADEHYSYDRVGARLLRLMEIR